ncbi:MAG: peptidase U32 [Caloramator sp.]|nr:MAG: peptidase U32 [Caloramator sp.]
MLELLAPAGDMESLKAAVLNGADAVYLGGKEFSARQSAANFDRVELIEAVRFCHAYNVKVYVTINTLLKNTELKGALDYASFLYSIGVDAVIVQDLGFLHLLRRHLPDFEVHASTQMTAHNLDSVEMLYDLGVKRVVLSRELSLDEINYISKNTRAELEMFVHGALCISFSGQCLMSSIIGGRSGNRGRCAQPCRLEYSLDNKRAYHLSPKDLSTLEFIDKIKELGVYSLKIEGRMKRPEYVATVVSAYRAAIDGKLEKKQIKDVTQIFNRGGFTSAFMFKRQGSEMMSYKKPRNWGTYLGRVINVKGDFAKVKLDASLNDGDGVEVFDRGVGVIVANMKKDGKVVKSASQGQEVEFYLKGAKRGDILYKTSDAELIDRARESFAGRDIKRVPIDVYIKVRKNDEIVLRIRDIYGDEVEVKSEPPEIAINKPITLEKLKDSLSKTKDTPYILTNLTADLDEDVIIPVSRINSIRREGIEKLLDKKQNKRKEIKIDFNLEKKIKKDKMNLILITGRQDIVEDVYDYFDEVYFGGDNLRINNGDIEELIDKGYNVNLWIPEIILEEEKKTKEKILSVKNKGIKLALCGNLGMYKYLMENGFDVKLDKGFNIFNSVSTEVLNNAGSLISNELNLKEIKDLVDCTNLDTMLFIYGRIKMMVSRQCFIGSSKDEGREECGLVCQNKIHYLKDRMNEEFLIVPDRYCRNHIYNSKILCMLEDIREIYKTGAKYLVVHFLDEKVDEARKISRAFREAVDMLNNNEFIQTENIKEVLDMLKGKITKGHYYRGVL